MGMGVEEEDKEKKRKREKEEKEEKEKYKKPSVPKPVYPPGSPERSEACCDGRWWMVDGRKKSSRILLKIFSDEVRCYKCAQIWKICKKLFVSEKNPTLTFKKSGFFD